jgi:hypothetical protein
VKLDKMEKEPCDGKECVILSEGVRRSEERRTAGVRGNTRLAEMPPPAAESMLCHWSHSPLGSKPKRETKSVEPGTTPTR